MTFARFVLFVCYKEPAACAGVARGIVGHGVTDIPQ
jgi:hypothetical protein